MGLEAMDDNFNSSVFVVLCLVEPFAEHCVICLLHLKNNPLLVNAADCSFLPVSGGALSQSFKKALLRSLKHSSLMSYCGRNTHFRRICFSLSNFNFKYIDMKFEELRDNRHNFWRNNAKTGKQKK